jgi:hypothetical protein
MSEPTVPAFVALKPDDRLRGLVQGYKDRARELIGDQLYLDDPPHLTVYLACYPEPVRLAPLLRAVAAETSPPRVRLVGWHAFENDALTGRHTLTCAIHPDDKQALRAFQARVVAAVAAHRDRAATEARFAGRFAHLTAGQRRNVVEFGFPYVGDGWEPHFTVASIDPAKWDDLLAEFRPRPPGGPFFCSALEEYQLDGIRPVPRGRLSFPGLPQIAGVPQVEVTNTAEGFQPRGGGCR